MDSLDGIGTLTVNGSTAESSSVAMVKNIKKKEITTKLPKKKEITTKLQLSDAARHRFRFEWLISFQVGVVRSLNERRFLAFPVQRARYVGYITADG